MYALFINISVRNWHISNQEGTTTRLLHDLDFDYSAHNKSKSILKATIFGLDKK